MTENRGATSETRGDDIGLYLGAALAVPVALLVCLLLFGSLFLRL